MTIYVQTSFQYVKMKEDYPFYSILFDSLQKELIQEYMHPRHVLRFLEADGDLEEY